MCLINKKTDEKSLSAGQCAHILNLPRPVQVSPYSFFCSCFLPDLPPPSPPIFTDSLKYFWHRAWVETAIVHLETVARVETRDHTDQPVTQVDTMMMVVGVVVVPVLFSYRHGRHDGGAHN